MIKVFMKHLNNSVKMKKVVMCIGLAAVVVSGAYLIAADHIDSPALTGSGSDITDVYAFESPENDDNLVFVVNVQGLLTPGATAMATFDEEVMVEINIDNSASKDNMEDLVIQATFEDGKVKVYGPVAPKQKGLTGALVQNSKMVEADISTYGQAAAIGDDNDMKVFAGPRDDPFFFDLNKYKAIIGGTATEFANPGTDAFAGTNVMSLVVEVPKNMLGASETINIWATSNRKM
jgi:hypothetical protein